MGVTIPAARGGAGRDYVTYALAVEAVALASATLAVILTVNNSLVAEPILEFGSAEQQDRWLAKLATGEAIGAFALSEEQAGSDAANQQTVARPDGAGFVLSGRKVWVANAEAADVAIVFATIESTDPHHNISAFLVPHGCQGDSEDGVRFAGRSRDWAAWTSSSIDVRVEASAQLGEAGRGFRVAMRALEGGRVAIAAQALGVGQAALEEALAYSRSRDVFGQPLGDFQAIQFQLADLATDLEAARVLTWRAADGRDRQPRASVEAAMAKLQASEAAHGRPIARCRSSPPPATVAARPSSACSATSARRRSTRERPKSSG